MIEFSTYPMEVLRFTRSHAIIQAAIEATKVQHGLADTDIGRGLEAALAMFKGRPYTGSRVILLVSDGGAHIDRPTRERITHLMKRDRVALYWIYIRSFGSPGLMLGRNVPPDEAEAVPEHFLNEFFLSMGTPYRAYQAENPDDLGRAIRDVDRLENSPIHYIEMLPRLDLSQWCYGFALAFSALLVVGKALEIKEWKPGSAA